MVWDLSRKPIMMQVLTLVKMMKILIFLKIHHTSNNNQSKAKILIHLSQVKNQAMINKLILVLQVGIKEKAGRLESLTGLQDMFQQIFFIETHQQTI